MILHLVDEIYLLSTQVWPSNFGFFGQNAIECKPQTIWNGCAFDSKSFRWHFGTFCRHSTLNNWSLSKHLGVCSHRKWPFVNFNLSRKVCFDLMAWHLVKLWPKKMHESKVSHSPKPNNGMQRRINIFVSTFRHVNFMQNVVCCRVQRKLRWWERLVRGRAQNCRQW